MHYRGLPMKPSLRNAPASGLTYCQRVVFKLWLAALVVIGLLAFTQVAFAALLLTFDQSAYQSDVWLQVDDPTQTFAATYGGTAITFQYTTDVMSLPVKVSDIMNAGGLNVTYSSGAFIYLFYDQPTDQANPPEPLNPAIPSYSQRWQGLELTMTGGLGDQGDLTAIDCFTAPLSITSYDADGNQLQQTGFGRATATLIGNQLKQGAVFGGKASPVATDTQGKIYRYIGPSKFNPQNPQYNPIPWPSFIPYIQSIPAGQTTNISPKPQGFYFKGYKDLITYHFGANMTAYAGADGGLTVSGAITGSYTGTWIEGNPPIPTGGWPEVTFTFPATNPQYLNFVIYGQADGGLNYVQISGAGWQNFTNFLSTQYLNPSDPSSPTLADPPPATNAAVAITVSGNIIGEITTGVLGGFFNSNYVPSGSSTAIKDMASHQWWALNPIVAYSQIQSFPYYNVYAKVIFTISNNTVYGVPYSDRFGTGPLVNSVSYGGKNVATWVIGIGAPLPATRPLSGMLLDLLLNN